MGGMSPLATDRKKCLCDYNYVRTIHCISMYTDTFMLLYIPEGESHQMNDMGSKKPFS